MKVLVTGANGLLGQHLIKLLLAKRFCVIGTGKGLPRVSYDNHPLYSYREADLLDEESCRQLFFPENPGIIVHAAAKTQVDDCELNRKACIDVNVGSTQRFISNVTSASELFIYVSTDFVFDGEKGNYREEDETRPVNWYGNSKQQAERIVQASSIPWAIVRTCLVYGQVLHGTRNNIVGWVKSKLEKGEKIQVVDDQYRTPTYVEDLARGILLIIEKKARGIFHISGSEMFTPYAMAIKTAAYCGLDCGLIEKVDGSVFSQLAKRPPKTGFIIDKSRLLLGYEPLSFEEGLKTMFPPH